MHINSKKLQGYTICYHNRFTGYGGYIESGWQCDNRGGPERRSENGGFDEIVNISDSFDTSLIRRLSPVCEGTLLCDFSMHVSGEGAAVGFRDENDCDVLLCRLNAAGWERLSEDGCFSLIFEDQSVHETDYRFRLYLDLDSGECHIFINDTDCGRIMLLSDTLASFHFTALAGSRCIVRPEKINITANYAAYEDFSFGGLHRNYGWTELTNAKLSSGELTFDGSGCVTKVFPAIDGVIIAEMMFFQPVGETEFSFSLSNEATEILGVSSKNENLSVNSHTILPLWVML